MNKWDEEKSLEYRAFKAVQNTIERQEIEMTLSDAEPAEALDKIAHILASLNGSAVARLVEAARVGLHGLEITYPGSGAAVELRAALAPFDND